MFNILNLLPRGLKLKFWICICCE